MVIYFNDEDLVSFGNYLLDNTKEVLQLTQSLAVKDDTALESRLNDGVTHADIENWAFLQSQKNR